jgi:hypothetical protein
MAARTVSNTGGNWDAVATWVGGVVPIAGDTVDFTATSGNLTVNVTTATLVGINFTNYLGIITFNANIAVNTSVNLGTVGYTQAGSGTFGLTISTTTTITSNGVVWNNLLAFFGSSQTYTLADNLTVTGNITISGTGSTTFTGNTLYISGNLTITTTTTIVGGTEFVFNGTGTWAHSSTGVIQNNVTINTTGTLTIGANIYYNTGILTYTAGTVDTTTNNSTLNIGASTTLDTDRGVTKITWNNIRTNSTITLTLSSNLNTTNLYLNNVLSFVLGGNNLSISDTLIIGYATGSTTFNTPQNLQVTNLLLGNGFASNHILNGLFTISVSGNLTQNQGAGTSSGTTSILLNGTGTWSNTSTGALQSNLTINTIGDITISGNVYYSTGTFIHTLGNVVTTNSTLNIGSTATINASEIFWNNIIFGTGTQTLISNLNCKNLTSGGASTNTINGLFNINVSGNLTANGIVLGTSTIILIGTGLWTSLNSSNTFRTPVIINANGIITLANTLECGGNLTYIKGTVKANNTTISFTTSTLINLHKLIFKNVLLGASSTITMNEFFSGSPSLVTNVNSTSGSNYTIAFQDGFEKISKFVNISSCTLSKPLQLLVLTKSKINSRNSGIRYINQSPNGIAKNKPSIINQTTYNSQMLISDPGMK